MKNIKISYLACALIFVLSGCSKDGETGPQGIAGTNGANGNANVHSKSFTITSWTYLGDYYYANITDVDITQAILDKGVVIVYRNLSGALYQLPYIINPSTTYTTSFLYSAYLSGVSFYITNSDLAPHTAPGNVTFKVVVAEGV